MSSVRGGWAVNTVADNAEAIATKLGQVGKRWTVTQILASYEISTDTGIVEIKVNGVVRISHRVANKLDLRVHPGEIAGGDGEAVSIELDASGTAGQDGYVTIVGGEL